MKDKNLYLFDLDGVIIDSKKNMKISWNSVNNKFRLNKPFKEYFSLIGRDFQDILKKMKILKTVCLIERTEQAEHVCEK